MTDRRQYPNLDSVIDCVQQYGVFIVDGNGTIIHANRMIRELPAFGDRSNIINENLGKYLVNYGAVMAALKDEAPGRLQFEITTSQAVHLCSLRVKKQLRESTDADQSLYLFSFSCDYSHSEDQTYRINQNPSIISFPGLAGSSSAWTRVKNLAVRAAGVFSNVLIVGESGTGKEMLTQAIHSASGRQGPFVPINCGAIPKELLQSELFGYEEGSFTGARKGGSPGKLELANGGTVFFDEIGEMPADMQVSLLRFLQDRKLIRVGGSQAKTIDVRVIAATNRDLEDAIRKGLFREDLYYRLNVISIHLPPLRQRPEDIPLLVRHMLHELCLEYSLDLPHVDNETMDILQKHRWPGNVRELRNVIEHAVVFSEGLTITPTCLPQHLSKINFPESPGGLKGHELQIVHKALAEHDGNISATARYLGITRSTLYRKLEKIRLMAGT